MDFCLRGMQEEGESKGLPPSRKHKQSMCKSKERGSRLRKERESSQLNMSSIDTNIFLEIKDQ